MLWLPRFEMIRIAHVERHGPKIITAIGVILGVRQPPAIGKE
jgi:hypothetical protein